VTNLYGISNATQMAVPTATGFVLLGAGLITARPDVGPVRLMASEGPGGSLVRGVLPLAVGGIVLLAVLRLAGQAAGLYGTQVGTWLFVSCVIAMLIPLVWRVAWSLDEADAERRDLAQDNEAILNSAGSGIFRVDGNGCSTFVNPAAAEMLGWPEAELRGQHMHSVCHKHADGTTCRVDDCPTFDAFSNGQVHHRADELFWRRDGSRFDVEYTSAPVRESGRVVGATVVFSDISERRSTERELADKRIALERSNAALEEFAAVAAHDLNSPMSTVAGFADLLEVRYAEQIGDEGRDYLRRISRSVARSQALIRDLLAFTRADRVDIEPRAVDMDAVVEDVLLALSRAIDEKGVRVDVAGLPPVLGDAMQLQQLIQNLISNAIKFSDAETPVVEVAAEARSGIWSFSITDNGLGIPPARRTEVFAAFKRVHGRDIEGTGIGLAICQRIVERHGGEIHVEAGIDGGSRFVFTLPGVDAARAVRTERILEAAGT
ncbi:MAG: ATP-binding protein, partial [Candidatus Limnocylindria bacterium]